MTTHRQHDIQTTQRTDNAMHRQRDAQTTQCTDNTTHRQQNTQIRRHNTQTRQGNTQRTQTTSRQHRQHTDNTMHRQRNAQKTQRTDNTMHRQHNAHRQQKTRNLKRCVGCWRGRFSCHRRVGPTSLTPDFDSQPPSFLAIQARVLGLTDCIWPRGVTVSTLDPESSDCGSNPREACGGC